MSHLDKLQSALAGLKLEAEYWDARVEETFETNISIVNGELVTCSATPSLGALVRIRKQGFWRVESTTEIEGLRAVLERLDKAPPRPSAKYAYSAEKQPPFRGITAREHRFSAVPMAEKIKISKHYETLVRGLPHVASTQLRYKDMYKEKCFLNSVGTSFEYDFNHAGLSCWFSLKRGKDIFEDRFRLYAVRFPEFEGKDQEAREHVAEAARFLDAPAITPGKYRVLLDPDTTGIFTHESFGHKSEADFMLGNTQALAEWELGKKVAASCLSIVDYGGHANTSGYCPIDDDGTPAQKNYLIQNGILRGRLHSRETAAQLGEKPTGNSRAMNFEFEPIVRMTSTYIEPGTESLDSLLQRAEGALILSDPRHGSGLSTFTIAPGRAYRIGKGGAREPVRVMVISGSVFDTLNNIEAVSKEFVLDSSAIGGCGKMDQAPLPVSTGGPYVLIKEMQVS